MDMPSATPNATATHWPAEAEQPPSSVYQPPLVPFLDIRHSDDALLVVDKPSGLLSVPGRGSTKRDSIANRAARVHAGATIVHRLDMDTSGLMVLAKTPETHRALSRQFERRMVEKVYEARVAGVMAESNGVIEAPLRCDWPNRPRQMIDPVAGRPAVTHWQVIAIEAG